MSKNCIHCGNEIPAGRLKAVPGTETCTSCSTTAKVAGHPIITGKTEYSALQIVDAETSKKLNQMQDRKGYGVSNGVKFDSDINNTSNGI